MKKKIGNPPEKEDMNKQKIRPAKALFNFTNIQRSTGLKLYTGLHLSDWYYPFFYFLPVCMGLRENGNLQALLLAIYTHTFFWTAI